MTPTEEWAKAEAVNVVAAIRGLGKDPCEWPTKTITREQKEALAFALRPYFPTAEFHDNEDSLVVTGWQTDPAPVGAIKWREFL